MVIDKKKYNVVQANRFVRETQWNMRLDTIKILKLLISRIDTKKPPKDNTIIVSKKEILNVLSGFDKKNDHYAYAKKRMNDLIRAVKVLDDDEKEVFTALVHKIVWNKNNDVVSVQFSEDVMPYLIVVNQFLEYDIDNVRGFRSKYGVIFYENLFSYYKQYKTSEYTETVEKLRYLTDTVKKFPRFDNWERFVLKAGIEDLNKAGVEILAKYEKIKYGKEVKQIKFIFRKRTSYREKEYSEVYQPSLFFTDDLPQDDNEIDIENSFPWERD